MFFEFELYLRRLLIFFRLKFWDNSDITNKITFDNIYIYLVNIFGSLQTMLKVSGTSLGDFGCP
jgi:hypothetical protein